MCRRTSAPARTAGAVGGTGRVPVDEEVDDDNAPVTVCVRLCAEEATGESVVDTEDSEEDDTGECEVAVKGETSWSLAAATDAAVTMDLGDERDGRKAEKKDAKEEDSDAEEGLLRRRGSRAVGIEMDRAGGSISSVEWSVAFTPALSLTAGTAMVVSRKPPTNRVRPNNQR